MRIHTLFVLTLLAAGCSTSPVTKIDSSSVSSALVAAHRPELDSLASVQQFLLAAAASDFHTHGPSHVIRFRDVCLRYLAGSTGEKIYILCGQFLPEKEGSMAQWTAFVTIRTDPYEQWIGGQAESYCAHSSRMSNEGDDLSSALQSRLDALH